MVSNIFYFHPYLGEGSSDRQRLFGIRGALVDKIPRSSRSREPSWHRKQRRARSRAREFINKFIAQPRLKKAARVLKLVALLESHHSAPKLVRARAALAGLGMSWQGNGWRGGYWKGAKGRSSKGKPGQDKKPAQDKEVKANIPQYDADCWTGGSSASSSKPSEAQPGNLQDITKLLKTVVQAGKIDLPPEALAILEATDKEDTRASYSAEQKALNAKRKAFNRVQRLRDAITKKTEKFKSFRLAIREQLANETERFEKDMVDLKDNLQKAERELERIESGEIEMEEPMTEHIDEIDIFGAMDIVKEKDKLKQQLEQSEASNKEMEARYMAAQRQLQDQLQAMQQQMQAMTGHGALTAGGLHGATWPITPPPSQDLPKSGSPQLPATRALRPFSRANTSQARERTPYRNDDKEVAVTSKCSLAAQRNTSDRMDRME